MTRYKAGPSLPLPQTQWKFALLYMDTPAVIAAAANTENTITWRSGQRKSLNQNQVSQNIINLVHASSFTLFYQLILEKGNSQAEIIFLPWHGKQPLAAVPGRLWYTLCWSGVTEKFSSHCFTSSLGFGKPSPLFLQGNPLPTERRCRFVFSYIWLRHLVQQASYSKYYFFSLYM